MNFSPANGYLQALSAKPSEAIKSYALKAWYTLLNATYISSVNLVCGMIGFFCCANAS
ncbi:MAG: hypothetical protein F6J89_06245 [Symploca sp. SIO1C4]|uniref:Uncharacterized protein n=1 Tax=Symploca sp. SIO1C4 TaxID=2607765 RepID=A0A6B3N6N5_9CYAN|nr:hypothetical protein [Symploca sp. SIO1C4]NET03470.1 hypothetical protein [Symploca sp. SIO2B6]NET50939.1 hypothetical protein [Merismopedia sp. SIO2A8]